MIGLVGQGQEPGVVHVRMRGIHCIQVPCAEDFPGGLTHDWLVHHKKYHKTIQNNTKPDKSQFFSAHNSETFQKNEYKRKHVEDP